jgi:hypothetical protein
MGPVSPACLGTSVGLGRARSHPHLAADVHSYPLPFAQVFSWQSLLLFVDHLTRAPRNLTCNAKSKATSSLLDRAGGPVRLGLDWKLARSPTERVFHAVRPEGSVFGRLCLKWRRFGERKWMDVSSNAFLQPNFDNSACAFTTQGTVVWAESVMACMI